MLNWYRIERVLGRGGFGVIYLATDTNLDHLVAIKEYRHPHHRPGGTPGRRISNELGSGQPNSCAEPFAASRGRRITSKPTPTRAYFPDKFDEDTVTVLAEDKQAVVATSRSINSDDDGLQRFIAEARNLVRFKHPNIVRVISVFELNDTAYMVMEFEEGHDLRKHLAQRENASESALKVLLVPIAQGLSEVHRHGFIHRDIKPANILVRTDGSPVLLDFGSARSALPYNSETLTALVSAGYAPLEQYSGSADEQQGPWTDIYALGAVLYYAVSGVQPTDSAQRGSAILNGGRDPLVPAKMAGKGRYSPEFLDAIDWALGFRIADRPQTLTGWMRAVLPGDKTAQSTLQLCGVKQAAFSAASKSATELVINSDAKSSQSHSGRDPLEGLSMRDQPAPREVQTLGARRRFKRRLGMLAWGIGLSGLSAFGFWWTQLRPVNDQSPVHTDAPELDSKVSGLEASSLSMDREGTVPLPDSDAEPDIASTVVSGSVVSSGADTVLQKSKLPDAADAANKAADEAALAVARQTELAKVAAQEEKNKQAAIEKERLARLRAKRRNLDVQLEKAERDIQNGRLDEAQASLDKAASIDRDDPRVQDMRLQWRAAFIDSRTPVSDQEFDRVIAHFDALKRALEGGDKDAMNSLTELSSQNPLFAQLIGRFSRLKIRIDQIRVHNADKSISANLHIEYMSRANGDRATPSEAYRNRTIRSVRKAGQWSLVQW